MDISKSDDLKKYLDQKKKINEIQKKKVKSNLQQIEDKAREILISTKKFKKKEKN